MPGTCKRPNLSLYLKSKTDSTSELAFVDTTLIDVEGESRTELTRDISDDEKDKNGIR